MLNTSTHIVRILFSIYVTYLRQQMSDHVIGTDDYTSLEALELIFKIIFYVMRILRPHDV